MKNNYNYKIVSSIKFKTNEKDSIDEINTKYILDKINNNFPCISIITGEVQSGKTNAVLNLINDCFLNYDYKFIIFLCGINNGLKEQSIFRINSFKKFNNLELLEIIDDINNLEKLIENYNSHQKIIFAILKEDDNLMKIYDFLNQYRNIFHNKKIMIIDDESDYASINTKEKNNKSKINDLITKLYNSYKLINMILLTATPYANILNSKSNELAKFIFTLKTNEQYTGIDFFNNLNNFYDCDYMNLENILNLNKNENDIAIYYSFFVWIYNTYLFLKEYPNEKSTLIIYISHEKEDHKKIKNTISNIVKNFVIYKNDFINWLKLKNIFLIDEEINEIKEMIEKYLINSIYVLNNDNKQNNVEEINKKKLSIVIGGALLSRGITYENLLVELFLYCSENPTCDTLLQRCRWFGYRRKSERYKYMKLITNNRIKILMYEAQKYNNILFSNSGRELKMNEIYNKIYNLEKEMELKVITNEKK